MSIAENAQADYVLLQTQPRQIQIGEDALERMLRVASDSDAAMIYADHYDMVEGQRKPHPVIDYQIGSIRDDFDFGCLSLVKTSLHHTICHAELVRTITPLSPSWSLRAAPLPES